MTPDSRQRLLARLALAAGVLLFFVALRYTDWQLIRATGPRLIAAAAVSVIVSGAWHVARTVAWAACFPATGRPSLARLFRIRLAAEAVSYVTVRGVAGEPLKVVLLGGAIDPKTATAAVALERAAYTIGTAFIIGLGAAAAAVFLPLSPRWQQTFGALAIGSLACSMAAGGLVFARRRRAPTSSAAVRARDGALATIGRFVADAAERFVALARGDRRRIAVLGAMTGVSFVLMALEVWLAFRLAGAPVTFTQALAIETFMRVASFAAAAIPGNLGVLEASSLAAAAAVGSPAGALLALARRLRGLFWAAAGFLVYPTDGTRHARAGTDDGRSRLGPSHPVLLYVADDPRVDVRPAERLAGLAIAERVVRAACRADYGRIVVLARATDVSWLRRIDARVSIARNQVEWRRCLAGYAEATRVAAIGPGTVVSIPMFRRATFPAASSRSFVDVPAGPGFPISGLVQTTVGAARDCERLTTALCDRVWLPSEDPPGEVVASGQVQLALRMPVRRALEDAERTIRRATYKATDAKLARFNRRLSLPISIALLRTPITANMMSVFVFSIGVLAAWLFSRGEYVAGIAGGLLSLAAGILDGCDGEIARLKYQESALGCWLETIGDYSYYLLVFIGLTVGAVAQTGWTLFFPVGATGLAGTILSFLLLIFLRRTITAGRPETLHAIAKARFKADPSWWSVIVWRISFVATRAAMPYGILALSLIDLLPVVVALSAVGANVYWLSLALKLRHLLGEERPAVETAERVDRLVPSS